MAAHTFALRYMSRFRCIAERCEDTCCSGLKIPVSAGRYALLRAALEQEPGEDRMPLVVLNPAPESPAEHAFIPIAADEHCPFLDTERLCSLQRRHGEEVLSDACASFPRVVQRRGADFEVAGSLACPEAARLCLLAEDAMAWEPAPAELVKRPEGAHAEEAPADPYSAHSGEVREALCRLLSRREYPLGSRLLFLGQLALRLDDFFFRGTPAFEGGLRADAEARLARELAAFEDEGFLAALHAEFSALELPGGMCAGLLSTVLRTRLRESRGERFGALARAALEAFGAADGPVEPESLWRLYAGRRARLDASAPERVEQLFRHYALNHVFRGPYTAAPTLLSYVFTLSLRLGLHRLALAGHPVVDALGAGAALESAEARERLDAAAVETFQALAKHVERHPDFFTLNAALAGAGGVETFGKVLVFAKFC